MTPDKVREVIARYRELLESNGYIPEPHPHNVPHISTNKAMDHCLSMLSKMELFLDEGRFEKTFRWLGFVQGYMWANRMFTLEDLKNHNRPDEE